MRHRAGRDRRCWIGAAALLGSLATAQPVWAQFQSEAVYEWGNGVTNVFTGDFNADGRWDIGVTGKAEESDRCWYIRQGEGGGRFGSETKYCWNNGVTNAFAGDFDGDGRWDIGVTGTRAQGERNWYIRYGQPDGSFGRETVYNWGNGVTNVFTGDFDGDGKWDIGVTGTREEGERKWYIRYGDGRGQFPRETVYDWGNGVTNVFTGDFDGDGKWDIGVTGTREEGERKWYIRHGDGRGQFPRETVYDWGNGVTNVFTGDFDGDGKWDIGVTGTREEGERKWYIRHGDGRGQFARETVYDWGNGVTNVFTGDFNGDRRSDIGVTGRRDEGERKWYIRLTGGQPAPAPSPVPTPAPTPTAPPAATGPVQALYVLDGTGAAAKHKNVMWHLHERFQVARPDLKYYWAGVQEAVTSGDAPKIFERAYQQICNDVKPVAQGGKGVTQVFLAGYSRGAIIAVNLANKTRRECGARVVYVGLLDPVNTTMPGWETALDRGVRSAVAVEKPSNVGATVLTTKYIDGVTRIQNPNKGGFAEIGAITHEQMACPVDDSKGARWNEQRLVEYAQRAGGKFAPKLEDTNAC